MTKPALFTLAVDDERKLIKLFRERKDYSAFERLVSNHIRPSHMLARKVAYRMRAPERGMTLADIQSHAVAYMVEMAHKWQGEGVFYAYYANAVADECRAYIHQNTQIVPLPRQGAPICAGILLAIAAEKKLPLGQLTPGDLQEAARRSKDKSTDYVRRVWLHLTEGADEAFDTLPWAHHEDELSLTMESRIASYFFVGQSQRLDPEEVIILTQEIKDQIFDMDQARERFNAVFKYLSHDERTVLSLRYLRNKAGNNVPSFEQIAGWRTGLTNLNQQQAAETETRAIAKLKKLVMGDFSEVNPIDLARYLPKEKLVSYHDDVLVPKGGPLDARLFYTQVVDLEVRQGTAGREILAPRRYLSDVFASLRYLKKNRGKKFGEIAAELEGRLKDICREAVYAIGR